MFWQDKRDIKQFSAVLGGFQVQMCECRNVKEGDAGEKGSLCSISFSFRLKHYEQCKSLLF